MNTSRRWIISVCRWRSPSHSLWPLSFGFNPFSFVAIVIVVISAISLPELPLSAVAPAFPWVFTFTFEISVTWPMIRRRFLVSVSKLNQLGTWLWLDVKKLKNFVYKYITFWLNAKSTKTIMNIKNYFRMWLTENYSV